MPGEGRGASAIPSPTPPTHLSAVVAFPVEELVFDDGSPCRGGSRKARCSFLTWPRPGSSWAGRHCEREARGLVSSRRGAGEGVHQHRVLNPRFPFSPKELLKAYHCPNKKGYEVLDAPRMFSTVLISSFPRDSSPCGLLLSAARPNSPILCCQWENILKSRFQRSPASTLFPQFNRKIGGADN